MAVYEHNIAYYDSRSAALFKNLSFDAGNDYTGFTGDPLSCGHVYGGMGVFLYASKYLACGGGRDVDDGDRYYIHVGFQNRHGILFQQCISSGIDWYLDCYDY